MNKSKSHNNNSSTKFGMYKGKINLNNSTSGVETKVNLHSITNVSSSAVGVMAAEITFNPNTTIEFANYAARFREYRVLAVKIDCVPIVKVNTSTTVSGAVVVAENKAGVLGTPTSYNQIFAMAKSHYHSVMSEWTHIIRADDYTDLDMGSTSTPGSEFSLVFYADALTASTVYAKLFMTWVVQFSSAQ